MAKAPHSQPNPLISLPLAEMFLREFDRLFTRAPSAFGVLDDFEFDFIEGIIEMARKEGVISLSLRQWTTLSVILLKADGLVHRRVCWPDRCRP